MASIWTAMREADGKTPMERFRIAQDHAQKCRAKFDAAQSDMIEAERFLSEASRDYMREYFPADRKVGETSLACRAEALRVAAVRGADAIRSVSAPRNRWSRSVSEHILTVKARIADDHTVWLTIGSGNVESELGVYGPYESRDHAEVAACEAVAHVARQMQKHKDRLLAQMIDV